MKAVGMTRKVDRLGRVILPKALRNTLEISTSDPVEIYIEEEMIFVKKHFPACIFCEDTVDVVEYNGKNICKRCLEELKALA